MPCHATPPIPWVLLNYMYPILSLTNPTPCPCPCLRQFLDRHGALLSGFKGRDGGNDKDKDKDKDSSNGAAATDGQSGSVAVVVVVGTAGFALKVLEDVTAAFLQQVVRPTHIH